MKITFVCTGNTCRSPMAQGIAQKICNEKNLDWTVFSAGIFADATEKTSENSIIAMSEIGIDIKKHTPTPLSPEVAAESDIIVPMTLSHKDLLISFGVPENKIRLLSEQIPDPYGQSIDVYRECRNTLNKNILKLVDELEKSKNS